MAHQLRARLTAKILRRDSALLNRAMHAKALPLVLFITLAASGPAWSADRPGSESGGTKFSLPPVESQPVSRFSGAQLAFVQSWIREKVPECPPSASETVADKFLEVLQRSHPEIVDDLANRRAALAAYESELLRQVALQLSGPSLQAEREAVAQRRVNAVLAGARETKDSRPERSRLLEKLKESSPSQYRRLVEGRMEDDDLQILVKKLSQPGDAPREIAPAKPKVMTAGEIVAEFARRNQTGSALQRLQAYVVEGRLKTATGGDEDLVLFRMRPDRFRLTFRSGGATRHILAASEGHFWQLSPGQAPQAISTQSMGARRYLAEFADPLFQGDDYTFERLDDGSADGKAFHRIAVKRADGSGYVARIDSENFREVGRENEDHSMARYSDFREVAGVIYAFREEVTDQAGQVVVFDLTRISPNPGLIQDLFQPPARSELSYFELESYLTPAPAPALSFK